ncbi:Pre-mRNA-splicing factor of RES complex, putative [Babesia bigemina]|uniref:Pre-mRNA-splicing factor of RES complex, putative n=1 Tax=Babesia bigemina TaxID=5866 RepID=A0A061D6K2_BABBI|nr:Pre-mRNA-splicing factor of RES complex, putative [Babesia bigemina]CDR96188.1 Pre-mRNA-splicing factor of RES complex, putative [Babesia bigemina]|eukprot:XP_012768374.1 Pre-mRNA-splicing factor of RES complex, putative [Babesia bigemina]
MKRNKRAFNATIIDNDELDFTSAKHGDVSDLDHTEYVAPLEESDADDGPVVVNAAEFVADIPGSAEERRRSPTPPRRTVLNDDDDVIYRDKSGRRITREQWLLLHEKRKPKSARAESTQELSWGKGLVQKVNHEAQEAEERRLAQQPLNRYDIDEEYDRELKARGRWSDPMFCSESRRPGITSPKCVYFASDGDTPKCRFAAVPNRFNIEPGYRWDGVIRGKGYEERWFKAEASRKAKQKEMYLNNIADM